MVNYTHDDGGRSEAGRKGSCGDCVVRAIAILTGRNYHEVYRICAQGNKVAGGRRSARNGVSVKNKKVQHIITEQLHLKRIPMPVGPKPTLSQVHAHYGNCIAQVTKHWVAIIDGSIRDTHDCRISRWIDAFGNHQKGERKVFAIWVKR